MILRALGVELIHIDPASMLRPDELFQLFTEFCKTIQRRYPERLGGSGYGPVVCQIALGGESGWPADLLPREEEKHWLVFDRRTSSALGIWMTNVDICESEKRGHLARVLFLPAEGDRPWLVPQLTGRMLICWLRDEEEARFIVSRVETDNGRGLFARLDFREEEPGLWVLDCEELENHPRPSGMEIVE